MGALLLACRYAKLNFFLILIVSFAETVSANLILSKTNPHQGMVGGWFNAQDSNQYKLGAIDMSTGECLDSNDDICAVAQNTFNRIIQVRNKDLSEVAKKQIKLIGICNPESQVVAGVNYRFTLLIKESATSVMSCHAKVFKKWSSTNADNDDHDWNCVSAGQAKGCQSLSKKMLGGQVEIDIGQEDTQKVAQWAVEYINKASNSLFMHSLQKVLQVSRQVINGYRYRISFIAAPTVCRNSKRNYGKMLEMCPFSKSAESRAQKCKVSVISSLGKFSMENFNCLPNKKMQDSQDNTNEKKLLGGDDHDFKPHKPLLDGDSKKNVQKEVLLGGDDHDYKSHSVFLGRDNVLLSQKQEKLTSGMENVKQMSILDGNDEDLSCTQYKNEFEQFKQTHQRFYGNMKEEVYRFKVFCENMDKIKKIQDIERGSAKYGVTQFSDITEVEFQKQYLGLNPSGNHQRQLPKAKIPTGPIPESWDWRDHGAVTPVKNQGSCGSCWAFSTTGNVEGQWAIKKKKLLSLSEQELVDCDKVDEGCNGGLPSQAYDAIMKLGGLETEKDYEYKGFGEKCHFNKTEAIVKVAGAVNISQDEKEIAAWLYHNGPISIGINAFGMQFYWGGIAHPWKIFCNPKSLDHGVLIVGYGVEKNEPYWIVKNSWGPSWGREGYYYVYRGDGTCGLNTMCTSATVE